MVRHKLISCSFESWIAYTLLQNYTVARCFYMGATLWRSFLLLGLRDYSALLGEDYERCKCWVTALLFIWYLISATRWRSCTVYGIDVVVEYNKSNSAFKKYSSRPSITKLVKNFGQIKEWKTDLGSNNLFLNAVYLNYSTVQYTRLSFFLLHRMRDGWYQPSRIRAFSKSSLSADCRLAFPVWIYSSWNRFVPPVFWFSLLYTDNLCRCGIPHRQVCLGLARLPS